MRCCNCLCNRDVMLQLVNIQKFVETEAHSYGDFSVLIAFSLTHTYFINFEEEQFETYLRISSMQRAQN